MYLVFDIGGTNSRIGVTEDKISILRSTKISTPQNFEEAIKEISNVAKELSEGKPFELAVGGVPGPIHSSKKSIYRPSHLPDWDQKPFVDDLSKAIGCEVHIQNDTSLIGLGEAVYGAGKGNQIVAFIGSGTGIGGSRIVNGRIDINRWGFEPGHHIINIDSDFDYWESYSSGSALKRKYGKNASEIKDADAWKEFEKYMAIGLYNVTLFWSPDIIVLGGGLGVSGHLNVDRINNKLKELNNKRQKLEDMPEVVPASLGDDGGLKGAIQLLNSKLIND